ncbi:site-2 protease family protein [Candidatus Woesearchaeota archaeon]|nr:site-2 protease family protein [Candidatus Woesearchaeota archaeon]
MSFDFQAIAAVVFLILLSAYVFLSRKKLTTHGIFPLFYFSMYKTRIGLRFMDKLAGKFNKTMKFLGYAGILVGFLGMVLLSFSLLQNLYNLIVAPEAQPGVGLVLPFKVKGAFFVPFFYWIISIFIIALVHEYAHGVIARAHKIKVKSSGFAFLGVLIPIIPAAFVEPDEKILRKRPHKQQLSIFAAGPFSNIILAFIVLGLSAFILSPVVDNMMEYSGVEITGFIEGNYPAQASGIAKGEIVKSINGNEIRKLDDFSQILKEKNPGNAIRLQTDKGTYNIKLGKNPEDESLAYLGVYVQQDSSVRQSFRDKYGNFVPAAIIWIAGLFGWLVILNLGIGLFNLVPIGPLDGGRMMQLVLHRFFESKKADKVWYYVSMVFLLIVVANIGAAFIK